MRIEISYHGGSATIGQLWSDYHSLQKHSDAVGQSMQSLIRFAYNMNGGVGCLQDAVSDLHYRSQQESEKQQALGKIEEKLDGFLEHAQSIDKAVATMVTQNQDEFYRVSGWARPAPAIDSAQAWHEKARGILGKAEAINEALQHVLDVHDEMDFDEMSDEELQAYYEEMLRKVQSGELTDDDRIRLNAFMEYLADVDVNKLKLEDLASIMPFHMGDNISRDCAKVQYYTNLYEAMPEHQGDVNAMNTFFSNYGDGVPESDHWRPEEELAMKFLAYKSPSPQHELLMRYIPEMKVAEFNAVDENGAPKCSYSPNDRMIHLNREEILGYCLGDYHAIYQEIGHNIDDLMLYGIDEPNNNIQMESIDGTYSQRLDQALQNDVSNRVWKEINDYNDYDAWFGIDGPGKQKIYDVMMGKARYEDLNPRLQWAYDKISYNLKSDLRGLSASDAYESQSDGNLVKGVGHGREYWRKAPDYDKTEVFSEWFASGICNSEDYKQSKEMLPETYQTLDEMIKSYLRNNPNS